MRKFVNFVISTVLGTAVATALINTIDNMIIIPVGKEWLAYVALTISIGAGIAFGSTLNRKLNDHKRGE